MEQGKRRLGKPEPEPHAVTSARFRGLTLTMWWGVFIRRMGSSRTWEAMGFAAISAVALLLTTWRLADNGYANGYYAAAVKSMATNAHAFFFVSLDPGGFVSIDKPPLGFWIQVLSVKLFGVSPLAVLLPQALLGALCVPLLGLLVRRAYGVAAGLLAALALALTPIWMVTSRDNIVDIPLTFVLLLGASALLRATMAPGPSDSSRSTLTAARLGLRQRWRTQWADVGWLVLAFALVGVGFNIKMLEAYLVLPAFILTYMLLARRPLPGRVLALTLALVTLVVISLAWVEVVDLTPASQRPYVGSTATNSELDLAFGYNGLDRLLGRQSQPGVLLQFGETQPSARVGEPGLFRFFQRELGSQSSWLLPLALLGLVAAWRFPAVCKQRQRRANSTGEQEGISATLERVESPTIFEASGREAGDTGENTTGTASTLLWGIWLLTGLAFFSVSRRMDDYYLVALAPAFAAAVGFGVLALWRAYSKADWRGWLAPLAIAATLCEQAYLVGAIAALRWLGLLLVVVGLVSGITLGILRLRRLHLPNRLWRMQARWPHALSAARTPILRAALATLLTVLLFVAPTIWTLGSLLPGNSGSHPIAGLQYANWSVRHIPHVSSRFIAYLYSHRDGAYYLVGTRDSSASIPLILATDAPIMTMGGFGGDDPILTVSTLQRLITSNTVRFFYLPASNVTPQDRKTLYSRMFPGGQGALSGPAYHSTGRLDHWIATHCIPVPPPSWDSDPAGRHSLLTNELFDCSRRVN